MDKDSLREKFQEAGRAFFQEHCDVFSDLGYEAWHACYYEWEYEIDCLGLSDDSRLWFLEGWLAATKGE